MISLIIVDDHQLVREGLCAMLIGSGQILVRAMAENGKHALELLGSGATADLLLCDIEMPVMDGLAMLEQVSRWYPKLPVVMLSMNDGIVAVQNAFDFGAKGFISKSIDLGLLAGAIVYMYSVPGKHSFGLPAHRRSPFTAIDGRISADSQGYCTSIHQKDAE